MKKISTLFQKTEDLRRVTEVVNPDNAWVIQGEGVATRKFDGAAAAIIDGELHKRYDVKKGRVAPEGAIPCQEPDEKSGHHPHWVKCNRENNDDKYFFEGFDKLDSPEDGTYELCGERVRTNPEKVLGHALIKHGLEVLDITDLSYEGLRAYLETTDIEGIVFHHVSGDGRMCKIRKADFGIKR